MYIIIVGDRDTDLSLAGELAVKGNEVCMIRKGSSRYRGFGSSIRICQLNAYELDNDLLLEAGIGHADVLYAVTESDNMNITISLLADRLHHVSKIVARLNDGRKESIYRSLGIQIVDPAKSESELLMNQLC